MSLTFQEACRLVKPGYYFKHLRSGWTEYFTQYGRNLEGELFWTAGNTVGGPLRKKRLDTDNSGFFIYAYFRDPYPIDPKDQVERKLEPEAETVYRTPKRIELQTDDPDDEAIAKWRDAYSRFTHSKGRAFSLGGWGDVYLHPDYELIKELGYYSGYNHFVRNYRPGLHLLLHTFSLKTPSSEAEVVRYAEHLIEEVITVTQPQPAVSKESNVENVAVAVDDKDTTEIIKNDQDLFISKLNDIVDGIASDEGGEAGHGARLAISQTLDVIDGKDGGKGYFLIAKQEDLMMVPATKLAYQQMNESMPITVGLDIAGNLGELFEGINS